MEGWKQKKPASLRASSVLLVAPLWVEHSTNGFWFVWLSPLPGLCLHHNNHYDCIRWVPSSLYTFNKHFYLKLRSALPCALLPSGFTEFDTIPYPVSKDMAHLKYESAALTKHELRGLKLYFATTVFIMLLPQKCRSTVEANYTTFLKLNLLFLLHFITIFNEIE